MVLFPKKDGSLRVCTTVNQSADVDQYLLPNAEDLFATLAGGGFLARLIYLMPISKLNWMKSSRNI